jgi:hypothetical protein
MLAEKAGEGSVSAMIALERALRNQDEEQATPSNQFDELDAMTDLSGLPGRG